LDDCILLQYEETGNGASSSQRPLQRGCLGPAAPAAPLCFPGPEIAAGRPYRRVLRPACVNCVEVFEFACIQAWIPSHSI
jgi:hypothetical protein